MDTIEFSRFKQLLREGGFFVTKARLRLFAYLHHNQAITIKELIGKIDQNDQSTVYRNVLLFEQLGIVQRLQLGWQTKIELSDIFLSHHHHVTCIVCDTVSMLPEDAQLEEAIHKLVRKQSFNATDHQLEVRGICTNCQQKS